MRVVRIVTRPNLGGPARQAIALWHAHRALGVRTLLVTGVVDSAETPLDPAAEGVPRLEPGEVLAAPAGAQEGWLALPSLRRGIAPWSDLRARAELVRLLRHVRPDVVHTHTSKAGWIGRRAARAAGVPRIVHTFHGHVLQDYFAGPMSALLRRLERRLAARTDVLIAVSPSCADELAAAGIAPRARFAIVPPAVPLATPLERGAARQRLAIPRDQVRLACIGRLVPIKRADHFVAAIAQRAGWHGDLFGDGPEAPALRARIAALAPGRVTLRGAVPDVARLLPAYDALVVPSVREGCPLVAVEAFAAGVPVVGYDVPGVRDALAVWGAGVLVPPQQGPAGLAGAVERCLDAVFAAGLARRARGAIGRFAPAAVAQALLEHYGAVLGADGSYDARPRG